MVTLYISVHIGFDALLGLLSSDCDDFVIRYSCFLKFSNGSFSNTVISEMLLVMSTPPIVATFFMKPSILLIPTG